MRTLTHLDEFRREAQNALFTKQQAISVTLRLLELEKNSQENTDQESVILEQAMRKAEFRYIDQTKTETDRMLDECGVARITAQDIIEAINALLFDVQ